MCFYADQSPMSDPGAHAESYRDLPDDPRALCQVVQGMCIHILHAAKYGVQISEDRIPEVQIYPVRDLLDRIIHLDCRPLHVLREPERRLVANCRHYALLLCSMLRDRGIPARLRCGFETYLTRGRFGDHWVCEYWDKQRERWMVADAELDAVHCRAFRIAFDPMDVPGDQFIPAGEMWRRCRNGLVAPAKCGFLDRSGLWYVRDNVIRDVLCLNKTELHPWDGTVATGPEDSGPDSRQCALIDYLAKLTVPQVDEQRVRHAFEEYPELNDTRLFDGKIAGLARRFATGST